MNRFKVIRDGSKNSIKSYTLCFFSRKDESPKLILVMESLQDLLNIGKSSAYQELVETTETELSLYGQKINNEEKRFLKHVLNNSFNLKELERLSNG